MSKRVLILVAGQTEERFVKDVLGPAFFDRKLFFHPTILITKRVKDGPNFKGGVTNFAKFRNNAQRLLNGAGGARVTTLLDYYRLPLDFPGMKSPPAHGTPIQRVTPEEINERPEFAPSKRIARLFPSYKKRLHGPTTTTRIGLEQIRNECPHFSDWLEKLEAFAAA